jgi:hypothetical protein
MKCGGFNHEQPRDSGSEDTDVVAVLRHLRRLRLKRSDLVLICDRNHWYRILIVEPLAGWISSVSDP